MEALGAIGLVLLLAHCVAWVALVAGLAKNKPAWRAVVGGLLPPLGALWAWEAGLRRRTIAYGATLAAFAMLLMATSLAAR
jgi:hypothetical protein